jgi:glycosyltransferase involved in cell wall biosynthesis
VRQAEENHIAPMPNELLSVCIPTRNRAKYLGEILSSYAQQVNDAKLTAEQVTFYISDNASEDETPKVFEEFAKKVPRAHYSRNATNLGGDGNNVHIRTLAKGEYLWVIGDDELLGDKALVTVLELIKKHRPGLIIAYPSRYQIKLARPQVFATYRDFAADCVRHNLHALAEHTLISCNIFRADCWDGDYGRRQIPTSFPHMFGMIRPLMQRKAAVVLPAEPIIVMRDEPPPAPDGQWINLDTAWVNYFTWLRDELQLPELDPAGPSEHARQAMLAKMTGNPFKYLASNWRSLFQPKAYVFVFNRIFRRR